MKHGTIGSWRLFTILLILTRMCRTVRRPFFCHAICGFMNELMRLAELCHVTGVVWNIMTSPWLRSGIVACQKCMSISMPISWITGKMYELFLSYFRLLTATSICALKLTISPFIVVGFFPLKTRTWPCSVFLCVGVVMETLATFFFLFLYNLHPHLFF